MDGDRNGMEWIDCYNTSSIDNFLLRWMDRAMGDRIGKMAWDGQQDIFLLVLVVLVDDDTRFFSPTTRRDGMGWISKPKYTC